MTPSIAELQANLLKAGRGLGLPLGVAEDIAAAAPFILATESLNDTLSALLHDMESGTIIGVVAAIDQALIDGTADLDDRLAVRPLLEAARFHARRDLSFQEGRIIAGDAAEISKPIPQRRSIDESIWGDLQAFAARTYVAATDASRLKGAGAGLSDND